MGAVKKRRDRVLHDLSYATLLPHDEAEEIYRLLLRRGVIFTKALSVEDSLSERYPVRLAYIGPSADRSPSEVSLGPFAIRREEFPKLLKAREKLEEEAFLALMAFKRLEYEKLGAVRRGKKGFAFRADDDSLYEFLSIASFWDVNNPVVCEDFVWILPGEDCKRFAESLTGQSFSENDYRWWNVYIDYGATFQPETPKDYPQDYSLFPQDLFVRWMRYLTPWTTDALIALYIEASKGGELTPFTDFKELLRVINQALVLAHDDPLPDRQLLIKELYDFNALPYPVDAESVFDFLCAVGFLKVKQNALKVEYWLTEDMPDPEEVLSFPENWEKRVDKFLVTGSVLFSYLSVEEIISGE